MLHEELENTLKEKNRKRRIGLIVVYGFLFILLLIVAIRAVVLIYFPHSWLAKHFFNW
jgi:hypothetical protein